MTTDLDEARPHPLSYAPRDASTGLTRPARLVAIGYVVWGLVLLLFTVILTYAFVFVGRRKIGDDYPMVVCMAVAAGALTVLTLLSAYGMLRRRWRRFSIVVAMLNVCVIGFGTLFGGLALYMLLRRSAREFYGENSS